MSRDRRAKNTCQRSPAAEGARPSGRRSGQRAVPVMDPGLEAFLREIGHMAAEAVLRDLRNTGGLPGGSTNSPGGPDRTSEAEAKGQAGVGPC